MFKLDTLAQTNFNRELRHGHTGCSQMLVTTPLFMSFIILISTYLLGMPFSFKAVKLCTLVSCLMLFLNQLIPCINFSVLPKVLHEFSYKENGVIVDLPSINPKCFFKILDSCCRCCYIILSWSFIVSLINLMTMVGVFLK